MQPRNYVSRETSCTDSNEPIKGGERVGLPPPNVSAEAGGVAYGNEGEETVGPRDGK